MKIIVAYCILLLLMFSGCIHVEPLTVKSVSCCDLKKATKTETTVGIEVEIENPNSFPITVKRYNLAVSLNGNNIGNSTADETTEIPSKGSAKKSISATTSTKQLISGTLMMGLSALMGNQPSSLELQVEGFVVGHAKGISKRVRIKESYPLDLNR